MLTANTSLPQTHAYRKHKLTNTTQAYISRELIS